ncbi:hypothetical protein [Mucilaginibacter sp. L3T2-6]|uniref:hypothetical protein n=1 Tax=Mucilaginibacter sp. L3T2-6 TaxID=3062491 RepID=UPI002675E788|nr:hypothetical protein [Mucilaginibacter sp. L3T2-6]MDO3641579.1 hypothetical protein [Mucilaginibacter sp. L3T2-6]MDV6214073.1 hypothetical protein [Mucilaginibacter sp. L3T2-6]
MLYTENEKERIITISGDDTYAGYSTEDDGAEGDWEDEEDESFDDMAADRDDLHDIIVEEDIYDEDNDDHLPEEDI